MSTQAELIKQVDEALNEVRPHLAVDGGNIEIVEIDEDMTLHVKWLGACSNCSMSMMTMKAGVENAVLTKVPEIKAIRAVNGLLPNGQQLVP